MHQVLDPSFERLFAGCHHDPFSLLGRHPTENGRVVVRALLPAMRAVRFAHNNVALSLIDPRGLWHIEADAQAVPAHYGLICTGEDGHEFSIIDPYTFQPLLGELDLHLFGEGSHWYAYRMLGAHAQRVDDVDGVRFAVWAPSAERVSVVGNFNQWDGRRHMMRVRGASGVWELFIPGLCLSLIHI